MTRAHDRENLVCQYPRREPKSSKNPEATVRMGPITGRISGRWALRFPVDEHPVSPSPKPREATIWQNGSTVGLSSSSASVHHEGAR